MPVPSVAMNSAPPAMRSISSRRRRSSSSSIRVCVGSPGIFSTRKCVSATLAIAAVGGGETMVFDEIDAGIGGETAHAVGETLRRLAERAQVITITHLPQIATVADRHFSVQKIAGDPTHTRIEELDELLRREEIERMAGGAEFIATLGTGAS